MAEVTALRTEGSDVGPLPQCPDSWSIDFSISQISHSPIITVSVLQNSIHIFNIAVVLGIWRIYLTTSEVHVILKIKIQTKN